MTVARPSSRTLMMAIVAIGVGLRAVQVMGAGSLWLDEIGLARNVLEHSPSALVREPLVLGQVAPAGFLLAQKGVTAVLGTGDFAWRLVPCAAAIAALFLFWRLAQRTLDGIGTLVAVALFATAVPFVYYASQAKQYSVDVLAALIVLGCAERLDAGASRRGLVLAALAGAAVVWLSQPAMLVTAAAGAALVFRAWRLGDEAHRRETWRPLIAVVAVWAVSAVVAAVHAASTVSPAVHRAMHAFWSHGFPPATWAEWRSTRWPVDELVSLLGGYGRAGLGYPWTKVYGLLGLLGLGYLTMRGRWLAHTTIALGVVAVAVAVARQYPLADRLALYLVPAALLAIAAGLMVVWRVIARASRPAASIVVAAAVLPCLAPVAMSPPPYQMENVHPALAHLRASIQPGDRVWVFYGGVLAFDFYAARYGFHRDDYVAGGCHRPESRPLLAELDAFRGAPRVWVFIAHANPSLRERQNVLGYLDAIGRRLERFPAAGTATEPPDVELDLYDLSDPVRLAGVAAADYPVLEPLATADQCGTGESLLQPRAPRLAN